MVFSSMYSTSDRQKLLRVVAISIHSFCIALVFAVSAVTTTVQVT